VRIHFVRFADQEAVLPRQAAGEVPAQELAGVPRLRDRARRPSQDSRPVRALSDRVRPLRRVLVEGESRVELKNTWSRTNPNPVCPLLGEPEGPRAATEDPGRVREGVHHPPLEET
jgi:hypothetical protein